jgi:hypothetical protein
LVDHLIALARIWKNLQRLKDYLATFEAVSADPGKLYATKSWGSRILARRLAGGKGNLVRLKQAIRLKNFWIVMNKKGKSL